MNIPYTIQNMKELYWKIDGTYSVSQTKNPWSFGRSIIKGGNFFIQEQCQKVPERGKIKEPLLLAHGRFQALMGKFSVQDALEENHVVKMTNGHLTFISQPLDFTEQAQQLIQFRDWLHRQDIPFLFVMAPTKVSKFDAQLPRGIVDSGNDNADHFLQILRQAHVDVLDMREIFRDSPSTHYDLFYLTDTHWKPEYALRSFDLIVKKLNAEYGFSLDSRIAERNRYQRVWEDTAEGILIRRVEGFADKEKFYSLRPNFPTSSCMNLVAPGVKYWETAKMAGGGGIGKICVSPWKISVS